MHGSTKDKVSNNINTYDVVITTFDIQIRTDRSNDKRSSVDFRPYIFRRLIIDEFHQKGKLDKNGASVRATNIWCVSGTPFTSSLTELTGSAHALGHIRGGMRLSSLIDLRIGSPEVVATLKSVMIRHTKSQHIGGEVALSLPDATTETILLTMNDSERKLYNKADVRNFSLKSTDTFKTMQIEMILSQRRQVCANMDINFDQQLSLSQKTKLSYLLEDLNALRRAEPNMHVVVLTHHLKVCDEISKNLKGLGYKVLEVSSSVSITTRHNNIQNFQKSVEDVEKCNRNDRGVTSSQQPGPHSSKAKVLVATMKIGNVGITLTAASRVYLFEPCLHPQMEIQAAGRIHRLGQTKAVTVKKLVFRDTVESSIVTLHDAMKNGSIQVNDGAFNRAALNILLRE